MPSKAKNTSKTGAKISSAKISVPNPLNSVRNLASKYSTPGMKKYSNYLMYGLLVILLAVTVYLVMNDSNQTNENQKCKDLTVSEEMDINGVITGVRDCGEITIPSVEGSIVSKKLGVLPEDCIVTDIELVVMDTLNDEADQHVKVRMGTAKPANETSKTNEDILPDMDLFDNATVDATYQTGDQMFLLKDGMMPVKLSTAAVTAQANIRTITFATMGNGTNAGNAATNTFNFNIGLVGGPRAVTFDIANDQNTTQAATDFITAFNAVTELAGDGITATAAANVVTVTGPATGEATAITDEGHTTNDDTGGGGPGTTTIAETQTARQAAGGGPGGVVDMYDNPQRPTSDEADTIAYNSTGGVADYKLHGLVAPHGKPKTMFITFEVANELEGDLKLKASFKYMNLGYNVITDAIVT